MVGFIVATVLAILLIFVYSLMRIAGDADESATLYFNETYLPIQNTNHTEKP